MSGCQFKFIENHSAKSNNFLKKSAKPFSKYFQDITSVKKHNRVSGLSKGKYFGSTNDETVLISAQKELEEDDVDIYEVLSITSLTETETTTVIVDTGSARFALEIDQHSGKILNKEKLIR